MPIISVIVDDKKVRYTQLYNQIRGLYPIPIAVIGICSA